MLTAIIIILALMLIAQSIYLIYYKHQIKSISDQLAFVLEHQSFKFIKTEIKPTEINTLINNCNTLLEQSRELDRSYIQRNEVINQTIVSLSHDIRTPLTSLDGYLQLASRENNEDNKYIDMAASRVKQLNKLVDELFLYTKLQNPDYQLNLEPIDINKFIKNELFEYIHDFETKDKEPVLELPNKPTKVLINEHALERVFNNIIKNYFNHGEGDLHISHISNDLHVTVEFKNQFAPNNQINPQNLFTKFYKSDQSRSDNSSGLGLSIVDSLMKKMNGTVSATVDENQFIITLTLTKPDREVQS